MHAVKIFEPKDIRMVDSEYPALNGPDEVRVRVTAAGICGSDLHVYLTGDYLTRTPITMGHEFSGQVLEVGVDVTGFKVGDHVVGDSRVWCGECRYCADNQPNLCEKLGFLGEVCEGAFAEEIVLPAGGLLKIDPKVDAPIAALAEPLAVALHAINQAAITGNEKILILGAGPIGAMIHTALRIQGHRGLTVTDISEYRRQTLEKLGDDSTIIAEPDGSYDLVFETTGAAPVLQRVIPRVLRKGGQAILVGLFGRDCSFNFTDIVEKEWRFRGCSCFLDELPDAVRMLETHATQFVHMVSHQLPLSRTQEGFDILLSPEKAAMKVILTPQIFE